MQYFTFKLDTASQKLCVLSTQFGQYKYKHLPMGIKQSSDIAQEVMDNLLRVIDNVEIYIDDIGCFHLHYHHIFKHCCYHIRGFPSPLGQYPMIV